MTINFACTGIGPLTDGIFNSATREATTTAAEIAPYVNEGAVFFGDDNGKVVDIAAGATKNFSCYWYASTVTGTRSIMQFLSDGTALFEIYASGANLSARYWNGSAWVALGTEAYVASTLYRLDLEVFMDNSTGTIDFYVDGTLVQNLAATDTILDTPTTINEVRIRSHNTTASDKSIFSAIVVGDEDLKGIIVDQSNLTGAGTNSNFTGAYTDVDETTPDDTDFIFTSTDGHVSTFANDNLNATFASGYDVVGVVVNARAAKGPSGVANIKPAVYSNVTTGAGTSKSLDVLFANAFHIFTVDPDTASAWTYAGVNAMEAGVKASST